VTGHSDNLQDVDLIYSLGRDRQIPVLDKTTIFFIGCNTIHTSSLTLLTGDRQIPLPGVGFAAQSRDLTIPTERTENDRRILLRGDRQIPFPALVLLPKAGI
jgi:hypothetical protein